MSNDSALGSSRSSMYSSVTEHKRRFEPCFAFERCLVYLQHICIDHFHFQKTHLLIKGSVRSNKSPLNLNGIFNRLSRVHIKILGGPCNYFSYFKNSVPDCHRHTANVFLRLLENSLDLPWIYQIS